MKNLDWFDDAACLGTDGEAFFPKPGVPISGVVKRICGSCPVSSECLQYSLSFEPALDGVWGGMGHNERKALKGRLRRAG